ncbi:histidine kinase [Clonorchis sinensis]|uniref:Histidine kinase n=1 Tax=Clonorchis sinensis TaxID=79923 RepID=G7Y573_CLOSI|nr:histidine kinase [Clonorchis sinensis]
MKLAQAGLVEIFKMPAVPTEERKASSPSFRVPLKSKSRNNSRTREQSLGMRQHKVVEEHANKESRHLNKFSLLLESLRRRSKSADVRNDCDTHSSGNRTEPSFLQPLLVPSMTSGKQEVQISTIKLTTCCYDQYRQHFNARRGCTTVSACRPYSKKSEYCGRPLSAVGGYNNGNLTALSPLASCRARITSQRRPSSFHPTSCLSDHHNPYLYQNMTLLSSACTNRNDEKRRWSQVNPEQERTSSIMSISLYDCPPALTPYPCPAVQLISEAERINPPTPECCFSSSQLPMCRRKTRTLSPDALKQQIVGGSESTTPVMAKIDSSFKPTLNPSSQSVYSQLTDTCNSTDYRYTHSASAHMACVTTFSELDRSLEIRVLKRLQPSSTSSDVCQVTSCHFTPKLCSAVVQPHREAQQNSFPTVSAPRPASTLIPSDTESEFTGKMHPFMNGLRLEGAKTGDLRRNCLSQPMNCETTLMRQLSEPVDHVSLERQRTGASNGVPVLKAYPTSGSRTTNDCSFLSGHNQVSHRTNRYTRQGNRTECGSIPIGLAKGVPNADDATVRLLDTAEHPSIPQQQSCSDFSGRPLKRCERPESQKRILLSGIRNSWSSVGAAELSSARIPEEIVSDTKCSSPSHLHSTTPLGNVGLPPPMNFAVGPKLRSQPKVTLPSLNKFHQAPTVDRSMAATNMYPHTLADAQALSERCCLPVAAPVLRPPRPPLRTTSLVRGMQSREASFSDSNGIHSEPNAVSMDFGCKRSSFAESEPPPRSCSVVTGTGDLIDKLADIEVEQAVCNKETMWWLRLLPYKPSNLPNNLADRLRQRDSLILSRASPSTVLSNSSLPTSLPQYFMPTTQAKTSKSPNLMSQSMFEQRDPADRFSFTADPSCEQNAIKTQARKNRPRVPVRPSSLYTEKADPTNIMMSTSVSDGGSGGANTPQNSLQEQFKSSTPTQCPTETELPSAAFKSTANCRPRDSRFPVETGQTDSPLLGQYCRLLILCSSNPAASTNSGDFPTPSAETAVTPI